MKIVPITSILPHRFPFLFVDRVVETKPDEWIVCEHLVSHSSPILQGHFPGNPIVPGVVQVEMMAQAAILLTYYSGKFDPKTQIGYFIGISEAKFRAKAVPGEVLRIRIEAKRLGRVGRFSGEVHAGDELKSKAMFTAVIDKRPDDDAADDGA
ncbi:MAG: 3-hydroxyacyl-ACP dehydratase FabZ [Nannocystaceae bacterium]|nr:3-hydroxyacyl-ACP dehydratase FabZ [Nannocystaceae bacterium]